MAAVIVIAALADGRDRYGVLIALDPHTILGIYGPLGSRDQAAVLAGQRPFDATRADWARRQRWGRTLALAPAPPALLAQTQARTAAPPLAKTPMGSAADPLAKTPAPGSLTPWYRQRYVRCGNPRCRACADGPAHGPYWYALWREDGRLRSRYLGVQRPADVPEPTP